MYEFPSGIRKQIYIETHTRGKSMKRMLSDSCREIQTERDVITILIIRK